MRISSIVRRSSLLSCVLLVGACGYSTKASFQEITFLSPDAQDAKCLVYSGGVKYQVWPPQTVNIKKSDKPMLIECHAPGNRSLEVEVPAKLETVALWGTPAGMAWDYASSSLFSYPEVIAIDFSQESLKAFPLPKHNNADIRQPEDYDLEEFLPGYPRLNSDKNKQTALLKRRGEDEMVEEADMDASSEEEQPAAMQEVEAVTEVAVEAEAVQMQEVPVADNVLTPIGAPVDEAGVVEVPVQDSTADSAPVPLVPGE